MDISRFDKADVLRVLYNRAQTQGMGILHYTPESMTKAEAQKMLDEGQTYFEYVNGRVMKVDLEGDDLDTRLFNRDNGQDAAENALDALIP